MGRIEARWKPLKRLKDVRAADAIPALKRRVNEMVARSGSSYGAVFLRRLTLRLVSKMRP